MRKILKSLALIVAISAGISSHAWADILIAPTRVVLEDRERSAELTVVNKGTERQVFRLMIENRRMLENGTFEPAIDLQPGELFAADMLRYAPRRVVLEPGQRQTIRIMARRPGDLAPGEYRSHLRLMTAPENAGLSADQVGAQQGDRLSISLVPVRSITIPVIVRKGSLGATIRISDARMVGPGEPGQPGALFLRLDRNGTRSTFGHITVSVAGQELASLRGVAVYVPNDTRTVRIPLTPEQQSRLAGQSATISYVSPDLQAPEVYARTSVLLR